MVSARFDDPPCRACAQPKPNVDAFVFQGSPQALDEDVVHPAAASVHTDTHLGVLQYLGETGAGKLTALVGVENLRRTKPGQGVLQCLDAEIGFHGVGQLPGQHLAGGQSITATKYRKPLRMLDNSASVSSPLTASSATFALKSAV